MRPIMSRRGALTLLALAGLPGCTRRTPAPAGGGPATIHWFAFRITNSHLEPRHALIDAFRRADPWVNVELVSAPTSTDQGRDALHDMISGDDRDGTPDVYLGDVIWPAEFAENRLALPLDNLFPPAFWS